MYSPIAPVELPSVSDLDRTNRYRVVIERIQVFSDLSVKYIKSVRRVYNRGTHGVTGNDDRMITGIVQSRLSLWRLEEVNKTKVTQLARMIFKIVRELPSSPQAADDIKLLPELMNVFLLDKKCLRDMLNLRMVCTTTLRCAFPVPHQRHVELPQGTIESFLGGEYAGYIPLSCISQALSILP